jgi:hypothetical protein
MLKAVTACDDAETLAVTYMDKTSRLNIRAGKFKTFVKCVPDTGTMFASPAQGTTHPVATDFLACLRRVAPFMAVDATRPWAMGVRLAPNVLYATNNVVLIQSWHGQSLPCDVIIPAAAVNELLRQKEEPKYVQVSPTSITFWYAPNRRITSQLVVGQWPDKAEELFEMQGNFQPIVQDFWDALTRLKPFCEDTQKVYFLPEGVANMVEDGDGTYIEAPVPASAGCFHIAQLLELAGVATTADFSHHPRACPFRGDKVRGVIIGPRQ